MWITPVRRAADECSEPGRAGFGQEAPYGHETPAVAPHDGIDQGSRPGAAAYLHTGVIKRFSINLRGEVFSDYGGVRTGIGQTLKEATVTPRIPDQQARDPAKRSAVRALQCPGFLQRNRLGALWCW
jgi:hypothetical protein